MIVAGHIGIGLAAAMFGWAATGARVGQATTGRRTLGCVMEAAGAWHRDTGSAASNMRAWGAIRAPRAASAMTPHFLDLGPRGHQK